ncbi:MAG: hypothetical protein C4527_04190, partial [Candidatus Omnitrophota bacterium]
MILARGQRDNAGNISARKEGIRIESDQHPIHVVEGVVADHVDGGDFGHGIGFDLQCVDVDDLDARRGVSGYGDLQGGDDFGCRGLIDIFDFPPPVDGNLASRGIRVSQTAVDGERESHQTEFDVGAVGTDVHAQFDKF